MIYIKCQICGKKFRTYQKLVKEKNKQFCSIACKAQSQKGKTPWNKRLTSQTDTRVAQYGQKSGQSRKGKSSWNRGLKANMGIKGIRSGAQINTWKGGITPKVDKIRKSIEFRLWREAVFARDNWTCQKCEERGGKLQAHHIQNFARYPELRFAINNGITFCKKCHQDFHKKYGIRNNTKEQIEQFL